MQEVHQGWSHGVALGGVGGDLKDSETGISPATGPLGPLDDPDRFAALYEVWRGQLARYCLNRLGDRHEAEDVTQEVFARAWNRRSDFTAEKSFYCWLRVVATNLCTDTLERRRRSELRAVVDPGPVDGGHDRLVEAVDRQLVVQAVGKLKSRHRSTLIMREQDGLTYQEIAARTGVSTATVESLLWRARRALKREFLAMSRAQGTWAAIPVLGALVDRGRRTGRWGTTSIARVAAALASATPTGRVGGAMILATCAAVVGVVGTQPGAAPYPVGKSSPRTAIPGPAVDRSGASVMAPVAPVVSVPVAPVVSVPVAGSVPDGQVRPGGWPGLAASGSGSRLDVPATSLRPAAGPALSHGFDLDVPVAHSTELASGAPEASLASAGSVMTTAHSRLDPVSGAADARLEVTPTSLPGPAALLPVLARPPSP